MVAGGRVSGRGGRGGTEAAQARWVGGWWHRDRVTGGVGRVGEEGISARNVLDMWHNPVVEII